MRREYKLRQACLIGGNKRMVIWSVSSGSGCCDVHLCATSAKTRRILCSAYCAVQARATPAQQACMDAWMHACAIHAYLCADKHCPSSKTKLQGVNGMHLDVLLLRSCSMRGSSRAPLHATTGAASDLLVLRGLKQLLPVLRNHVALALVGHDQVLQLGVLIC